MVVSISGWMPIFLLLLVHLPSLNRRSLQVIHIQICPDFILTIDVGCSYWSAAAIYIEAINIVNPLEYSEPLLTVIDLGRDGHYHGGGECECEGPLLLLIFIVETAVFTLSILLLINVIIVVDILLFLFL